MNYKALLISALTSLTILGAQSLKGQNQLIDGEEAYRLYVKIRQEALVDVEDGKVVSFSRSRSADSELYSTLNEFTFSQVVPLSDEERQRVRSGVRSRSSEGFDKTAFSGLLEVEAARFMNKSELLGLAEELEAHAMVEYCELSPLTPPPPPSMDDAVTYTPPATGNWVDKQFYLYGDNGGNVFGIYADYAWEQGITGQGVSIVDIEWGWDYQHEDFAGQNMVDALTTTNPNYNDHGTAVAGQMYAANNSFGVTGAVYGADAFIGISEITKGRPAAIAQAMDSLEAGDVLVYEMQTGGGDVNGDGDSYVPADYSQTVWDLTKEATEAGIIVVAAAGNGGEDLDNSYYNSYNARGDNGSIIVGAGTKIGRNRTGFSTHGERVDVCGIGDWSIYTTGYGGLYNGGPHATYTATFSGTSSSTPIVASAVVAIQSYAKNKLGRTILPLEMRELLKETGTASGTGWSKNTPLPNVKAVIAKLNELYGGTKYALTVNNGTGSGNYDEAASVEVTAKDSTGFVFAAWTGDVSYLSVTDNKTATVTMPAQDIAITATYTSVPTFELTVTNASGSGEYAESESVTVTAVDSLGYVFEYWSGDNQYLADSTAKTAVVTMPGKDIALTAEYRKFTLVLLDQMKIIFDQATSEWSADYGNLKATDGDSSTFWHSGENVTLPQSLTYKLENPEALTGFKVLPRQDDSQNGRIKDWVLEISSNGTDWETVKEGIWADSKDEKIEEFETVTEPAQYVRITALSSTSGEDRVGLAEFNLFFEESGEVSLAKATVVPQRLFAAVSGKHLNLGIPGTGNYKVSVMNTRGQIVYRFNGELKAGVQQLPLSSLSAGMVLVSVEGVQSRIVTKQILK